MTDHIRTKWHRLRTLIVEDQVYMTAPKGGRAIHWDSLLPDREKFATVCDEFEKLPRFVVDSELLELVMADKYKQSLIDMQRAGVFRLPFPAMVVEFQWGTEHHVVMLRDFTDETSFYSWERDPSGENFSEQELEKVLAYPFYGIVMRLEKDQNGEYCVLGPSHVGIKVEAYDDVRLAGFALGIFRANPDHVGSIVQKTLGKDGQAVFRAIATAMLVMHTEGVKREVIECNKINRTRIKNNKPPVPRHTLLSIGKVYRSNNEEETYDKRRSPMPHWRRGHIRTVRFGEGRTQIRTRYIPPRLVAFKEFDIEPSQSKTYHLQK